MSHCNGKAIDMVEYNLRKGKTFFSSKVAQIMYFFALKLYIIVMCYLYHETLALFLYTFCDHVSKKIVTLHITSIDVICKKTNTRVRIENVLM